MKTELKIKEIGGSLPELMMMEHLAKTFCSKHIKMTGNNTKMQLLSQPCSKTRKGNLLVRRGEVFPQRGADGNHSRRLGMEPDKPLALPE